MKWLKKLRLINWHYFHDETLEFGKQTLITGQNGAGKSTIIDALQVLFVADQRQIRFNAAAHEEAKRTLIHYLRGKIGSDEKTFLRDGDFTTYIVAEFYDEYKKEPFVVGVVIDVYKDNSIDEEYFILAHQRLDDLKFVKPSGVLRNREEFKRLYGGEKVRGRQIFERNKANYRKAFLARMGQLHDRFFSVFTKAISFKPIQDVRQFVYDYILDPRELKLDVMKQNFEYHERYKHELEELNIRRDRLLKIRDAYERYAKRKETIQEQDYVIRRLKFLYQQEQVQQMETELETLEQRINAAEEERAIAEQKEQEAILKAQEAYQRWQNHAAERRKQEIMEEQARLKNERHILVKKLESFKALLEMEIRLLEGLLHWEGQESCAWTEEERQKLQAGLEFLAYLLEELKRGGGLERAEESANQLNELGQHLSALYQKVFKALTRLEDEFEEADKKKEELMQIIRDLENKKRPYRPSVNKLRQLLEDHLKGRSKVWVFCEEMEVVDESWRDAVEGYLNTQRFDLLVEPHAFAEALHLYEREKFALQIEGVGLVDTEKEQRYLNTAQPGSLAEVLVTDNPVIQAHIDHLLGRVMRAEDEQELRQHRTAITRTCMVYNRLVARQIPKENYDIPYIGAQAIPRQLEIKRAELEEISQKRERLQREIDELKYWKQVLHEKESYYARLTDQLHLPADLVETEQKLVELEEELNRLDLREVEQLKSEYHYWEEQKKEWNEKSKAAIEKKATLETKRSHLIQILEERRQKKQEAYLWWQKWREEHGQELEQRALIRFAEAEKQPLPIEKKIENWENNWKGNITRLQNDFQDLQQLRQKYNIEYFFHAPINDEKNDEYDRLLHEIEHLDIPLYQQKVEEALKESEEEFKSHFIFKLREAIEMAKREFHELNHALRRFPFAQDQYHFVVEANEKYKRFYDVIMDPFLVEKGSLFDDLDQQRSQVLHELFELLVRGEAGDLEEFTDYRQYLHFDIKVRTDQTEYRFSKVLKEKSGGETQTPFYIAILASFYHLYRSGHTMRLVVFDEAFNKMDERRIQTSLRLIKQLNLQLIASVPDEKMQHMIPEVTTTIVVHNHNYRCFVDMAEVWDETVQAHTNKGNESRNAVEEEYEQEALF